ncbi:non-canonical purine NTP pyrophosphatase, rdgB/HAM1 family, partial [mine drainage metagenome]
PGPYSSYVNTTIGYEGLQRLVAGKDSSAYFKTVVSLSIGDRIIQFGGILRGRISTEAAGSGGFGFDPVFVPDGQNLTLAEMDVEAKNRFSHRARAVSSLLGCLLASQK